MRISRLELFDKVWTTPLTKLAKELDISDVGLAKLCRRNAIPLPVAGHWAKAAAGKAPPKPHLPEFHSDWLNIDASRHRQPVLEDQVEPSEFPELQGGVLTAPPELGDCAGALQVALSKAKPDSNGFVRCGSSKAVTCEISEATIDRVVHIVNLIEHNLHAVGARFTHDREKKLVRIRVEGEDIGLSLTEGYKRTEIKKPHPHYKEMMITDFTYSFNGLLRLQIDADTKTRRAWNDGVRARVEEKIDSFLCGVVAAARGTVQLRKEREAQRLHWEEERKRSEAEAAERRQLEFFRTNLIKEAKAWEEVQMLRKYLAHLREAMSKRGELPSELGALWLRQAQYIVEDADPTFDRVSRLRQNDQEHEYYGLFGDPVVDFRYQ